MRYHFNSLDKLIEFAADVLGYDDIRNMPYPWGVIPAKDEFEFSLELPTF